ncbi:MAG: two-component system, NarL family, sensor kinase [Thermoleophilaceae bacterium]|jgi:signal transduction histidine kinase|nr:two-component system, NarL family, sensor kinase [Thermoleophilaceae bacterium]
MLRRLPIESAQPLVVFAIARLAIAVAALLAIVVLGFPYEGKGAAVVGGLAVPWAIACLVVARREPELVLSPLVPAVDLLILLILEWVAPDTYGAVRAAALFMIAAHAHFQGESRGVIVAALGSAALVTASAVRGDTPVPGDVHAFYETVFVVSCLATGLVVGSLRTAESASRLRARSLSRRTIQAEAEVRRRVAEAIHDGPVQELIGLDMILSSARKAASEGRGEDATRLIDDARELTERNIHVLRDGLVELGPHAFEELSFESAIENCLPLWKRRYGVEVLATIDRMDLLPEVAGDLFRIAQEAVVNAGRHADAEAVSINLRSVDSRLELRVADNGRGFGDVDPLGALEPGHLGLAMMRERAELLGGRLDIETSERGTRVLVVVPVPPRRL